ncbi:TonB-dependent receptor [Opitutales bacterium]|nr:TonB-dependent receptor [Opitutales bacterium]
MKSLKLPLLLLLPFAFAQGQKDKQAAEQLDALVVESSPLDTKINETTQSVGILTGDELDRARSKTIAETLSDLPGVNQTQFGPSANRPIIRGQDKFRIKVVQNGSDSFDVSGQSEDHAVPIDPLLVDRIEILRGSSALLHGGSAIGGVVNVIDRSIPIDIPSGISGSLLSSYSSVDDGFNSGITAFAGSDNFNFQINGFIRDFNDYETPSFYKEDHHSGDLEGPFNLVKNSHGESQSIGFGGSYKLDSGYTGFSFSNYENDYGVPGEHAESDTLIEMERDRFEFRSEIEITDSEWLRAVELNLGYADYKHSESGYETEDNVTEWHTHSTYFKEGFDAKIAFDHEFGVLRGVFGVHGVFDEFKIEGEESILGGLSKDDNNNSVPQNDAISSEDSTRIALFLIEQYALSDQTILNGGIRWESFARDYEGTGDRDDSLFSASGGASHDLNEIWNISGNLSYSERAPDTAELYSDGGHHATESYDVGTSTLGTESAVGIEVILRKKIGNVTGQFSAFHTEYKNYIFLEDTEQIRDATGHLPNRADNEFSSGAEGLEEKKYESADAEFQGFEVEIDWLAMENPGWDLLLSAYGDMVRGKNKTEGGNLPRIPAARIGFGFEVQQEKLDFGMKFIRSLKQDKVAVHEDHSEEATDAYSILSAFASYDINIGDNVATLFLRGNNLTDELAFNHASVLKNHAPSAGRSVEVGLKFDF